MKKTKTLSVDAGSIVVMDEALVAEHGGKVDRPNLALLIPVKPGRYAVDVSVPDSWNGPIKRTVEVTVKGSALLVGDACYHFGDTWPEFLSTTDMLSKIPDGRGQQVETGGDGSFDVTVDVRRVDLKAKSKRKK